MSGPGRTVDLRVSADILCRGAFSISGCRCGRAWRIATLHCLTRRSTASGAAVTCWRRTSWMSWLLVRSESLRPLWGEVSVAYQKVSLANVDDLGDLARVARAGLGRQRPGTITSSAPCPLPTVPGARVTAPFDPHVSVRNTVGPRSFAQRHADRIGAAIVARPDSSTALPNRLRMAQACTVLQLNVRIEMFFWNYVE